MRPLVAQQTIRLDDVVRPHHLVIFMLDDVAMPDKAAGSVEMSDHPGDFAGIGDDCIFEAGFGGQRIIAAGNACGL